MRSSCCRLALLSTLLLMGMDASATTLCVKTNDPAIPAAYRCPASATPAAQKASASKPATSRQAAQAKKVADAKKVAAAKASQKKAAQAKKAAEAKKVAAAKAKKAAEAKKRAEAKRVAAAKAAATKKAAAKNTAQSKNAGKTSGTITVGPVPAGTTKAKPVAHYAQSMLNGKKQGAPKSTPWKVRLKWVIPATREDGKPLLMSDLAGYELYYVSEDETRSGVVAIKQPQQADYVLSNLEPGAYFFAITAIDRRGLKSRLSDLVRTTVGS